MAVRPTRNGVPQIQCIVRLLLVASAFILGFPRADAVGLAIQRPVSHAAPGEEQAQYDEVLDLLRDGKLADAASKGSQLLDRIERVHGAGNAAFLQTVLLLAEIAEKQNRAEQAGELYGRAAASPCLNGERCSLPEGLYYDFACRWVRNLRVRGKWLQAERALDSAMAFMRARSITPPDTNLLYLRGDVYLHSWRPREATEAFREVLRLDAATPHTDPEELAIDETALASALAATGNVESALLHARHARDLRVAALGKDAGMTLKSATDVAELEMGSGNWEAARQECGPVMSNFLAGRVDNALYLVCVDVVVQALRHEGKIAEAEDIYLTTNYFLMDEDSGRLFLMQRAIFREIQGDLEGAAHFYGAAVEQFEAKKDLGSVYVMAVLGEARTRRRLGDPAATLGKLEALIPLMEGIVNRDNTATSNPVSEIANEPRNLFRELAFSMQALAEKGGGRLPGQRPSALLARAFEAAQRAGDSAASKASNWAMARSVAAETRYGTNAVLREELLSEIAAGDAREAQLVGSSNADALRELREAQHSAIVRLRVIEDTLRAAAPRYWDAIAPTPLSLASLHDATPGHELLGPDDVLLLLFEDQAAPANPGGVIVFAVTREGAAFARATMTAEQVDAAVGRLRCSLDRENCHAGSKRPFDRATAFALYRALFSDHDVGRLLQAKSRLLVVANGALSTIPLSVLVTVKPSGPDTMEAFAHDTAWLIGTKTIVTLPSVNALHAPAQRETASASFGAPVPYIGFAPQFEGPSVDQGATAGAAPSSFFRGGAEGLRKVRELPRLSNEEEVRQLGVALGGASPVLGADATEAEVYRHYDDGIGDLARARVIVFATHGLVSGDFSFVAEPALAFTPPSSPDAVRPERNDGLLTASEVAGLRLRADWVILSACNTGAGATPDADGLSGLARAFFLAGARNLLVSHWRVDDAAARFLTEQAVRADRPDRAGALAEAQRRMIAGTADEIAPLVPDRTFLADPARWAPFVVVGR